MLKHVATQADVRRIALSLPETVETPAKLVKQFEPGLGR